ncbi:LVIVD repeat-containing protein [Corallococcus llansteffanensis]|uniref:Lipoprotein n=1 Tax=Corallococcus llansteffanensis TaxID=2316731 RepID=A0A3A8Q270_9BACT|nr:hypothetical protein [Corallococcus llansteffanensis]RKH62168.1 hypothetical protein D7V93_10530 [Corallococcus llansteffanensis]
MTSLTRILGTGLFACALSLSLSGCNKDDPEVPDAAPPDAGPVVELTDYVDVEPDVSCRDADFRQPRANCQDPASFDLSGCDLAALGTVEPRGTYRAILRYHAESTFGAGFRVGTQELPGTFLGLPLVRQQVDRAGFFITGEYTTSAQRVQRYALAGCRVPEPGRITGCFVRCTDGVPDYSGTFDARRMTRAQEEPGASVMRLVSESAVPRREPVDVYVTKGHAYVVSINRGTEAGGLTVYDVADKLRPVPVADLTLPNDSYWNGVWAKGDALYVASANSGVIVYDISNPADPRYVRALPGGPINVHTVFVDGDRLYAMSPSPNRETLLFDVGSPLEPQLLSRIIVPREDETSYPHDAFAYQDRLYTNHTQTGFVVQDVTRPDSTPMLGMYAFAGQYSHASAVGTIGGRTIAFEGGERFGAHLRVLDVTAPANIRLLAQVQKRTHTSIHNMVLKGTKLYVAWYHEGVRVLDVADPEHPRELAAFDTFQEFHPRSTDSLYQGAIGIRVPGDGYVYVVDLARGLLVFEDPAP